MTDQFSSTTRDDLLRQIERIGPDTEAYRDVAPAEQFDHHRIAAPAERQAFGRWLLLQQARSDSVGALAKAARLDPAFPKNGDPEAVRARLRAVMAEGEMFEAVDDAELDWASL